MTVTIALALAGAMAPAGANVRVRNGDITFGRFDPKLDAFSLWVADAGGHHQKRLTHDPANMSDWAPDGSRIVFDFTDEVGDVHLAVIRADGTGRRSLTTAPGVQEVPSWSSDGRLIAYDAFDPVQPVFSTSIWVMRADGTHQRRLTSDGFDVEPDFSPDGRRIVFARIIEDLPVDSPEAIYVVNTDGTGLHAITPPIPGLEHPRWSPNGKTIVFDIGPEGYAPGAGSVYSTPPDGTGRHVLIPATKHVGFFKPRWSPDARRLLLGCFDDRVGRDRLCTSTARGTHVRVVPLGGDAPLNFPGWGPAPRHG